LTFAIAGLALGFGALFPKFNTENAAQIRLPSGTRADDGVVVVDPGW